MALNVGLFCEKVKKHALKLLDRKGAEVLFWRSTNENERANCCRVELLS